MPPKTFAILLLCVLLAAGVTVGLALGFDTGVAGLGAMALLGLIALVARLLFFAK